MRYLYSAFLGPQQSRSATEWYVLTGSHFLPATHTTILTLLRKHSPDGSTQTRRHTSDIAYYSIYRPRKDERPSWPSWLTYSGRLTHINGHRSATGRAWDREIRRSKSKHQRSNHCATQPTCNHEPASRFVILAASVFETACGKTNKQTNKPTD